MLKGWQFKHTPSHLLDIANEFQQDDIRTKQLGLTEDELAFYDQLPANEKLLNQTGPIRTWCIK